MVAKDIMTREVITVSPAATVDELANILAKNKISGVPVVDKSGKISGVASQADVIGKKGKQVKDIMSKEIFTVGENSSIEEIAALMTKHRVKRLLVMSGQKLAGIVSRGDVVKAIAMGEPIALKTPVYDL